MDDRSACAFPRSCACNSVPVIVLLAVGWLSALSPEIARADTWPPPKTEHRSENGQFVLRVSWGLGINHHISLWKMEGRKTKRIWIRDYVDEQGSPPHMAYIANDGRRVVLRDVHHHLGRGKVIVFLDDQGELIKGYELKELVTQHEYLRTARSVSSTWWSEPGWFKLRDEDRQFACVTGMGTALCFRIEDGERIDLPEALRSAIVADATRDAFQWLKSEDLETRATGATILGLLDAQDAVPMLKEALHDTASKNQGCSATWECGDNCEVQLAAAEALAKILGFEALPLIEEVLSPDNTFMFFSLLKVMASVDEGEWYQPQEPFDPRIIAYWENLSESKNRKLRQYAIMQRLARDDGNYVRSHPALLHSIKNGIRSAAYQALARNASPQDVSALEAGTRDGNEHIRSTAFHALARVDAPRAKEIIKEMPETVPKDRLHDAWTAHMARRGDPSAKNEIISTLRGLERHRHESHERCPSLTRATLACGVVEDTKWPEAREVLEISLDNSCDSVQQLAARTLAVLQHPEALKQTRSLAASGDALHRAIALRALAAARDAESMDLFRRALSDREPWVRAAAKAAIEDMADKPTEAATTQGAK